MTDNRPDLGSSVIVNLHPSDTPNGDLADAVGHVTGYGDPAPVDPAKPDGDTVPTINVTVYPDGGGAALTLGSVPYCADPDAAAELLKTRKDNQHYQRAAWPVGKAATDDDGDDGDGDTPKDDTPHEYPGLADHPKPDVAKPAKKAAPGRR